MAIAQTVGVSRRTVYKLIDKALGVGAEHALKDHFHRPREASITDEAKAWVVNLACTKPSEHGYAAEMWSRSLLAKHVRQHAVQQGYPSLANAAKATVQRILSQHPIRPDKIAYYLANRDPEFEDKMKELLVVYNEVNMWKRCFRDRGYSCCHNPFGG